ncbi:MAG: M15 family metallopeptidase [Proteobacteria bacterium]|nr:M15 family metallopeptidase [Pseudomonadota bacterium]
MMTRRNFFKYMASLMSTGISSAALADIIQFSQFKSIQVSVPDDYLKDYLYKMKYYHEQHRDDILLTGERQERLTSTVMRLRRIEKTVGNGNFYLLDFDDAVHIARSYVRVGAFKKEELDFIEMIFYKDASVYGFSGQKPFVGLTEKIDQTKVQKIPDTGNYLYRGLPEETYIKLKKDIGEDVILTSGVRSITKQLSLFLNKAYRSYGNLSLASRSLAPPGYSFHAIGDFDVGQANFGVENFTERFTYTSVYHKLENLGYVNFRYNRNNMLGVRFEPWHIKLYS